MAEESRNIGKGIRSTESTNLIMVLWIWFSPCQKPSVFFLHYWFDHEMVINKNTTHHPVKWRSSQEADFEEKTLWLTTPIYYNLLLESWPPSLLVVKKRQSTAPRQLLSSGNTAAALTVNSNWAKHIRDATNATQISILLKTDCSVFTTPIRRNVPQCCY